MRLVFALALVAGVMGSAALARGGDNPKEVRGSETQECEDDVFGNVGDETYTGPLALWPPNHKYDQGTLTVTATDPEDSVNVVFTAVHDQFVTDAETGEAVEINGSGNTTDDITPAAGELNGTGSVSQVFDIRSERSGRVMEGRTYTISGTATFTDDLVADGSAAPFTGSSCDFEFNITVPHDQGKGNDTEDGGRRRR
jgi:hypothetical protein